MKNADIVVSWLNEKDFLEKIPEMAAIDAQVSRLPYNA